MNPTWCIMKASMSSSSLSFLLLTITHLSNLHLSDAYYSLATKFPQSAVSDSCSFSNTPSIFQLMSDVLLGHISHLWFAPRPSYCWRLNLFMYPPGGSNPPSSFAVLFSQSMKLSTECYLEWMYVLLGKHPCIIDSRAGSQFWRLEHHLKNM